MVGATRGTLEGAMEILARDGEVFTSKDPNNRNRRSYRLVNGSSRNTRPTTSRGRPRIERPLLAIETIPLALVTPHPRVVGPLDSWRGKMWEDMPGGQELMKKCNFSLWRRGMLKSPLPESRVREWK